MEPLMTRMHTNRPELFRKCVGILSLTVAILSLVSSMALANPSAESREETDSSGTFYIRSASEAGAILVHGKEKALPSDEGEHRGEEFTLLSREEDAGQALGSAVAPADSNGDTSGYKTKTVVLQKSSERPKPTIFLIEERSNHGELYLGLLSWTIPW